MSIPLNDHAGQNNSSVFFDVSPERLDKMSLAELKEEMERALDVMSEETYDPAVIDAYLEAMDRKDPMPTLPDPEEAYNALKSKLLKELQEPEQTPISKSPLKRRFKMGLVAVAAAMCLLGSMVVAQAAGADVFGALARWTKETFSFGSIRSEQSAQETAFSESFAELPPEYQELRDELETKGVNSFLFPSYIPDGFTVDDSNLSILQESDTISYTIWYTNASDEIAFNIIRSEAIYSILEKDATDVEVYQISAVDHFIFTNNGKNVAAWYVDNMEYSLTTTLSVSELKAMLNSMYQE